MGEHTGQDKNANTQQVSRGGGIAHALVACALLTTFIGVTTVSAGNSSIGKEVKPSSTKLLQPLKIPGLDTREKSTTKNLLKKGPKLGVTSSPTIPKMKSPFKIK
jgi:hypothetical protein